MAFDLDMIKEVYAHIPERVAHARAITGRPLTLSEKILFSHLWEGNASKNYQRGQDYVDFAPDRILVKMRRLKWLYFSSCKPERA